MQGVCELLPTALPSLVLCLQTLIYFGDRVEINSKTRFLTKCTYPEDFGFFMTSEFSREQLKQLSPDLKNVYACEFPSSNINKVLVEYKLRLDHFLIKHRQYSRVLNDFNLQLSYINSMLHEYTLNTFYPESKVFFQLFAKNIKTLLNEYYYSDLGFEFVELYVIPYIKLINEMTQKLELYRVKPHLNKRPANIQFDETIF